MSEKDKKEDEVKEEPNFKRKKVEPVKVEPAKVAPAKANLSSVEAKIEKIKSSKMPQEQKDWYIKKLSGDKEGQKDNKLVSFEIYARIRNIKGGEASGKKSFAHSQGVERLSLQAWDELFKKF